MSSGLPENNSMVVSAFQSALLHQALIVVIILVLLAVAWNLLRAAQLRGALVDEPASGDSGAPGTGPRPAAPRRARLDVAGPFAVEPPARRFLRISFGMLWIFDGILQAQASMPLGMTSNVFQPSASASPAWVHHVVNFAGTLWNEHPIVAATASVWIQLGIGLWLLVAPRGRWSRAGGAASAGWALVVWVFGEAFGGVFAPGLTWLFGAPGAVLFYFAAGIVLALPERAFDHGRVGAAICRGMGGFFVVMGVLQAWPGRGFWTGHLGNDPRVGTLVGMLHAMAQTPQPHALSSIVSGFASFDAAHGFAVNLVAVVMLLGLGVALLSARPAVLRVAVPVAVVFCVADWLLVEDLGFLGGTGTDPNSMIPIALLLVGGYMALTKTEVVAERAVLDAGLDLPADLDPEPQGLAIPGRNAPAPRPPWRERVATRPAYVLRVAAAIGAVAVVLLGAAPMAVASFSHTADPILAEAIDGTPAALTVPATNFTLTDQAGKQVSLDSLAGKVVLLTFLDPVCTSDCPIIASELRHTDEMLGTASKHVEVVAVVANPLYRSVQVMDAFDVAERLNTLPNWMYLTGSVSQLTRVWDAYGVELAVVGAGGMVAHSDISYVIDRNGVERYAMFSDPGPGSGSTQASFESVLVGLVSNALARN